MPLRGELVVVIDCAHLDRSAAFWTAALRYIRDGAAADRYQSLLPADGTGMEILLQRVPGRSGPRLAAASTDRTERPAA